MKTRSAIPAIDARRRLLLWSPAILAGVSLVVTVLTTMMLYQTAVERARMQLADDADAQARLIEAIIATNHGDAVKTLELLQHARLRRKSRSSTGEYTLATVEGGQIRWLLQPRHHDRLEPAVVPWNSDFAEPMRKSLLGQSGTLIGPDYRGVTVLAAHEPVLEMGWGVVTKVDMSEIRAPFIRAASIVSCIVFVLVVGTMFVSLRMVRPVIRDLELSRDAAEAANRAKSSFLAAMSHELRTPLNAIIGFSQGMLERVDRQPLSDHQKDRLGKVYESGLQLLSLINDVLDIAKVESGRMDVHVSVCSPRVMLADVHRIVTRMIVENPDVTARLDAPFDLPLMMTDADKVQQILLNLVDNAIKFTQKGMITLAAREEDDQIVFSVADTGVGIPADQWEYVFERHFQIRRATSLSIKGAGLGLPLSRAYAELLGGSISFTSQVGQGSTFTVRLPQRIVKRVEELLREAATV